MSEIQYMEKPDWVSWDDVCECIRSANVVNDKKGFHMLFSNITASELEGKLKDGACFVALHNNKVVGTTSYRILNIRSWYMRSKAIYGCYEAVLPEYRGTDVYTGLTEIKTKRTKETGIKNRLFYTAENNKTVIKLGKRNGFKLVELRPTTKGADYYSVKMVKWGDGCPFPDWFIRFMFNLSRYISKTFFTPEYRFKYWFHK